ncbi:MAG: hotdog fold thioesterase [Vibrio sp.]
MIWKKDISLEFLNTTSKNTLVEHLNIEYIEVTENTMSAIMPVSSNTHQPMGLLHGGASVVLAETLGSIAANMCVDEDSFCVGLDINANHIKAKRNGYVTGKTWPIHIGGTTQVWQIEIVDEEGRLICTSRITMAVRSKKGS